MHTLENIFVKLLETSVSISYLTSNLHLTSSSIMLNDAGDLQRDLVLCSSLPEHFLSKMSHQVSVISEGFYIQHL